jgi:hypothetical protein
MKLHFLLRQIRCESLEMTLAQDEGKGVATLLDEIERVSQHTIQMNDSSYLLDPWRPIFDR